MKVQLCTLLVVSAFCMLLLDVATSWGQAAQVSMGLARAEWQQDRTRSAARATTDASAGATSPALQDVLRLTRSLSERSDAAGLAALADSLGLHVESLMLLLELESRREGPRRATRGFAPQAQVADPSIAFAVGGSVTFGNSISGPTGAFELDSTILGAAVGSVFGLFGSRGAEGFFKDNVSAGISFTRPVPSAHFGLGLGEIRVRSLRFWPVFGVEQTDARDSRVPEALASAFPEQNVWSSPFFAIGFVGWQAPIFPTVGIRLPIYYSGGMFKALGALFNDDGRFETEGDFQVHVGVSVPIFHQVAAAPAGGEQP